MALLYQRSDSRRPSSPPAMGRLHMLSSRWQKLLRDLWMTRGRMSMMVLAIAVSIFSIGTVLNSYVILNREISRNYLSTKPAAATLEMQSGVDDALIAAVRKQPGI